MANGRIEQSLTTDVPGSFCTPPTAACAADGHYAPELPVERSPVSSRSVGAATSQEPLLADAPVVSGLPEPAA
jgi:hypothetical protein